MTLRPAASLRLLFAGAAKGIVDVRASAFEAETGVRIEATFDSAGATRNAFVDGAACDIIILPASMLDALALQRLVDGESIAALGGVPTGIAVALVGPLPAPFELAAVYAVAVCGNAGSRMPARAFAARLAGDEARALRRAGGFLDRSPGV